MQRMNPVMRGRASGVRLVWRQMLHVNLRPSSTKTMKAFMYALHRPQRTGPSAPKSTT